MLSFFFKGEFTKEMNNNKNSIFYFIKYSTILKKEVIDVIDQRIKFKANDCTTQKELFEKYGDGFISEINHGAEYYGLMKIETSSQEEKQLLSGSLSCEIDFKAISGSLEGSVKKNFENLTSKCKKDYFIKTRGGVQIDFNPKSLEDMFNMADNFFKQLTPDNCAPISISVTPYSQTENYKQLDNSLNVSIMKNQLEALSKEYLGWKTHKEFIEGIKDVTQYKLQGEPLTQERKEEELKIAKNNFLELQKIALELDSRDDKEIVLPSESYVEHINNFKFEYAFVDESKTKIVGNVLKDEKGYYLEVFVNVRKMNDTLITESERGKKKH